MLKCCVILSLNVYRLVTLLSFKYKGLIDWWINRSVEIDWYLSYSKRLCAAEVHY